MADAKDQKAPQRGRGRGRGRGRRGGRGGGDGGATAAVAVAAGNGDRSRGRGGRGGGAGVNDPESLERAELNKLVARVTRELALDEFDVTKYNRGNKGLIYHENGTIGSVIPGCFAKFQCPNAKCGKSWSSAKTGFELSQSTAAAAAFTRPVVSELFHQYCKRCKSSAFPVFRLDWLLDKLERVLKIMAGQPVTPIAFDDQNNINSEPHEDTLCVLCLKGLPCTAASKS